MRYVTEGKVMAACAGKAIIRRNVILMSKRGHAEWFFRRRIEGYLYAISDASLFHRLTSQLWKAWRGCREAFGC